MRLLIVIAALLLSTQAFSETRRDKSLIVEDIANKLFEGYKTRVTGKTVLVLAPKGSTTNFTADERSQVRQRFISKIQGNGYIVVDDDNLGDLKAIEAYQGSGAVADKQVQEMGNKAGVQQVISLTFSEVVGRHDAHSADVVLTVDLRATDVKTGKINIAKTVETKYDHETYQESYYARDTAAWSLGMVKWGALVGSAYFTVLGSNESEKAKKWEKKAEEPAVTAADKEKYTSDSEKHAKLAKGHYMYAGGALGLCILSWIAQNHLEKLPRDTADYHKYSLSFMPVNNGTGNLMAFNFELNF